MVVAPPAIIAPAARTVIFFFLFFLLVFSPHDWLRSICFFFVGYQCYQCFYPALISHGDMDSSRRGRGQVFKISDLVYEADSEVAIVRQRPCAHRSPAERATGDAAKRTANSLERQQTRVWVRPRTLARHQHLLQMPMQPLSRPLLQITKSIDHQIRGCFS